MSTLFATLLITHVVTGIIGAIGTYLVVLALLKKDLSINRLKAASWIAFLGYMTSWFSGGYYYWFYYGAKVKPVIKAGDYVWAHNVVMEAKEHIFFLLPILAFTLLSISYLSNARLTIDPEFKSSVTFLASVTLGLAVLITLAGILITGGAQ